MKYKFKAKDIKTGEYVIGDLAYVKQHINTYKNIDGHTTMYEKTKIVPYIVTHNANGGMIYIGYRHRIDESTIELIKED